MAVDDLERKLLEVNKKRKIKKRKQEDDPLAVFSVANWQQYYDYFEFHEEKLLWGIEAYSKR